MWKYWAPGLCPEGVPLAPRPHGEGPAPGPRGLELPAFTLREGLRRVSAGAEASVRNFKAPRPRPLLQCAGSWSMKPSVTFCHTIALKNKKEKKREKEKTNGRGSHLQNPGQRLKLCASS